VLLAEVLSRSDEVLSEGSELRRSSEGKKKGRSEGEDEEDEG
jgi:hypothetical protein